MKISTKKYAAMVIGFMLLPALAACGTDTPTATPIVPTPTTVVAAPTDTVVIDLPTATTAAVAPTSTTAAAPATATTGTAASQTGTATDSIYAATDCSYGGVIKSIEAVDDNTVKFSLCNPDAAFPDKVAFASLGIQSAKHLQETGGGTPALLEHPIGTGPYMVQEWVRGDHLTLVANPNYWGTAAKTKTIIFKWNSEAAARLTSLKAGDADGIDNPDTNDFASIQAESDLKLLPRDPLNVFYLGMNNTKPPLDNEKVRQAVAMVIDKQSIVSKFYPAGSTVADYFTPCAVPGGCEGDAWYKYDVAAAKQLIADSGVATPINMKLAYRDVVRAYLPSPGKVAEELQNQLSQIGINVTIDVQASGTFLDNSSKGNLEMYLLGWGADYPDQTDFLDYHFGKGASDQFGTKFDDITALLSQAAQLSDQTQRNALYAQANTLVKQHVPMVPIAHGASAAVFNAAVEGAVTSPLGNENFSLMSAPGKDQLVWIQNAEPLSLYCSDESDGETLRACEQIFDPLLNYKVGGVEVVPGLAETYTPSADGLTWTFNLRKGVKFSDGTPLTAKDVVATYSVEWDVANKLHVGNTGNFDYWSGLFGAFLNAKK